MAARFYGWSCHRDCQSSRLLRRPGTALGPARPRRCLGDPSPLLSREPRFPRFAALATPLPELLEAEVFWSLSPFPRGHEQAYSPACLGGKNPLDYA
jgi:hypothetical protein